MNPLPFDEVPADPDAVLEGEGIESVEDLCVTAPADAESADLVSEVSEEILEDLFGDLSEISIEYADSPDTEKT